MIFSFKVCGVRYHLDRMHSISHSMSIQNALLLDQSVYLHIVLSAIRFIKEKIRFTRKSRLIAKMFFFLFIKDTSVSGEKNRRTSSVELHGRRERQRGWRGARRRFRHREWEWDLKFQNCSQKRSERVISLCDRVYNVASIHSGQSFFEPLFVCFSVFFRFCFYLRN